MKRSVFLSSLGLVLVLVVVVLVWLQLQALWFAPRAVDTMSTQTSTATVSESTQSSPENATSEMTTVGPQTRATNDGLRMADLPLSETQRTFIEKLGFDVDTMVLNQEVIDCAAETLGDDRYQEIVAGDTPSTLETARLLPCLGR